MAMPESASGGPEFLPGPPVAPAEALVQRLNSEAEAHPHRLVRLPVALRWDEWGLGIAEAAVAVLPDPDGAAIRLTLNDGAMSVPLATRVRDSCGAEPGGVRTVWLEGYWGMPGGAFPQEGLPEEGGAIRVVFAPVRVGGAVDGEAGPAGIRVGIEAEAA